MSARAWDGPSYDRVSAPMEALGREVVARMGLRGDETVLDAGCGSGRVTEALIDALPRGRVIAVDASESMVSAARNRLHGRADVRRADLLELELERPVDAVLSTATFHWIGDHDRLYAHLHAALRRGGRLTAQCGGEGNVAAVHRAAAAVGAAPDFAKHLSGWRGPWNFTSPAQAERALRGAGFADVNCWLTPVSVTPDEPLEYLRTIVLGAHLERLPAEQHDRFAAAVTERLGAPVTIDYVRLNVDAIA
jgi:trans-aconitate 2-methyltransferase